ncbi:MAG: UDP-N-acetylmuramoyl-tripeptide--D-alanyl-D-alanine ligase [Cytophagales bacterium]|nr:MAG: UDP-N-acetylmuramoyl-tripeptide--D-alanyl-D-alanine ligase [Cytophagales bacterium]
MTTSIEKLYTIYCQATGVSTDTRQIKEGMLFFALKGENFNGNQFADKALAAGAAYVVVDEIVNETHYWQNQDRYLQVEVVLTALQELASYRRKQFNIPFVAVCGSNGKTTTKELIHRALSVKYPTFATQGNLNNHIGVPLTLLAFPNDSEMVVVEMGANHIGETAELCKITQPTHGVVTNIGLDHLEGFGSLEGVKIANGELYEYLKDNNGVIFVNTTEDFLASMTAHFPKTHRYTYPQAEDSFSLQNIESDFFLTVQYQSLPPITTQLFGSYNFSNVATALAMAHFWEVDMEKALKAIQQYSPSNNRSQVIHKEQKTIILDAYNANPSSMEKALQNFAELPTQQPKIVILGDMFELGEASISEHERIGKLVAEAHFHTVILFGEAMQHALRNNPNAYYFTDKFSLHNWLGAQSFGESYWLIKGSRGVKLETVLQFL